MGYVYLILEVNQHGEEFHKIGITKLDITRRLKQLQTGNPNEISILNYYESDDYKLVERWLHSRYSAQKTLATNEWFKLSNEQVLAFLKTCKMVEENILLMKKENHFFKDL